jgi:hypothetical protein
LAYIFKVHLPVEIWQEIIKYLEKPELHAISRASAILRNTSLPFLFRTARFDAKDSTGLRQLAEAYVHKRAVCKNIVELQLDYRKAFDNAKGKLWTTVGVIWAEAGIYTAIERGRMSRLTTLVLREVTLVEVWMHSVLKCRTLRRLHLHTCWCDKWTKPFPPTTVREFVIEDIYHSPELEALATFLAPQLEVLEVRGKDWPGFPLAGKPLPTVFPETCPQLRKYVLRLPISGSRSFIASLHEFLIRTPTIEVLELCVGFSPDTVPLPSSALPDLRLYDATLSTGFLATHFINGPRKLAVLRIRDDFVRSYDRNSLHNSLHVPYEVSELHLTLHHRNAVFIPTQFDRGLPNIESLYLSMRVQEFYVLSRDDPNVCGDQTALDSVLNTVSEFVKRMKAAYPIQEGDNDCSKKLGFHKLKKVDVDIDVDSTIGTSPPAFEKWFHDVVAANCPALKAAYFRVWKVNTKGRREAGPTYWARWCMGSDDHWYYEGGSTSEQESA